MTPMIDYGRFLSHHCRPAADMFVRHFPDWIRRRFRDDAAALRYYRDLYAITAHENFDCCWAVTDRTRLVGFMLSTRRAQLRLRFALRLLAGVYGYRVVLRTLEARRQLRPTYPHMEVLFVEPEYRSTGIGRQMLMRTLDQLKGETISTAVEHYNATVIKRYEALGFVIERQNDEGVLMVCRGGDR